MIFLNRNKKEKVYKEKVHKDIESKYQHNLIPTELADNIIFGTSSIMYDDMGYPLRLFVDNDYKSHWIDIPISDIRENDVVVKLVEVT